MHTIIKKRIIILGSGLLLMGCSTAPTVNNYTTYMNEPVVKHGDDSPIADKLLNKPAWNEIKVAGMQSYRKLDDGSYADKPQDGILNVRATIVNSGKSPVQASWRCKFYDSNNVALEDDLNDERATTTAGLGWHTMVVYPLTSKSQTDEANLIRCVAPDAAATNYRIEVHDTANDVTVYTQ